MKKLNLLVMSLAVLFVFSSCMISTYDTPPDFLELLARFDEISPKDSTFSFFAPHDSVSVRLAFIGDDESQANIPAIRDAIAEWLMTDNFIAFIESEGVQHSTMSVAIVFHGDLGDSLLGGHIVGFHVGSVEQGFETWNINSSEWRFFNFLDGYAQAHAFVSSISRHVIFSTGEMVITLTPHLLATGLPHISEEEHAYTTLSELFDEIRPAISAYVHGQLNEHLEGLKWFTLGEGYSITINFSTRGIGYTQRPTADFHETMLFRRTEAGVWVNYH